MKSSFLCLIFFILPFANFAQSTCRTLGSSDWEDGNNWSCGHTPDCGDTVIINPGNVVQITNQLDYESCGGPTFLYVDGTLEFTNGNKLQLPCASELVITPSGLVYKPGNGGGNSTLLEICNSTIWKAGDGDFYGPYNYGGALPVTLLNFWVTQSLSSYSIKWSTATETDADFFRISKSLNGYEFTTISEVQSHHNSTTFNEYEILDQRPSFGVSYYKLEAFDLDGNLSYSDIKSIENLDETDVRIYPNPLRSNEEIKIEYTNNVEIKSCDIINMAGQKILCNLRIQDQQILISNLNTEGVYLVKVYTSESILQHKIVVQ